MSGIQDDKCTAFLSEPFLCLLGKLPDGRYDHYLRLIPRNKRQNEFGHLLTLISESLAESNPVSPCRLQGGIPYVYNKICHLKTDSNRQIYQFSSNFRHSAQFFEHGICLLYRCHIADKYPEPFVVLLQLKERGIAVDRIKYVCKFL